MVEEKKYNYTIGWQEFFILLSGYFASGVLLAGLIVFYTKVLKEDYNNSSMFLLISYVLSLGVPILFFDLFVTRPKGYKLNFNFTVKPLKTYVLAFSMMFGMMLVSEFLTNLIPTTGPFFGDLYIDFVSKMNSISVDSVALIIMVAVFAPLLEEILFRGIILKAMLNKGLEPKKAIFFSALIFGAIHGYPWQFLGAFLLGLILGTVYYKTKSLLLPILLHAFNNLIAAVMLIYIKKESFSEILELQPVIMLVIGFCILGVSSYYFLNRNKVVYLDN